LVGHAESVGAQRGARRVRDRSVRRQHGQRVRLRQPRLQLGWGAAGRRREPDPAADSVP